MLPRNMFSTTAPAYLEDLERRAAAHVRYNAFAGLPLDKDQFAHWACERCDFFKPNGFAGMHRSPVEAECVMQKASDWMEVLENVAFIPLPTCPTKTALQALFLAWNIAKQWANAVHRFLAVPPSSEWAPVCRSMIGFGETAAEPVLRFSLVRFPLAATIMSNVRTALRRLRAYVSAHDAQQEESYLVVEYLRKQERELESNAAAYGSWADAMEMIALL